MEEIQNLTERINKLELASRYEPINYDLLEQLQERQNKLMTDLEQLDKQPIIEESIEEVKKTVEEDNISDEEVEESKRTHQILPTHKNVLRNTTSKEYNFLSNLISASNFNSLEERNGIDMEAYLYEKDLQRKLGELESQGVKVPSKNTIKKHMNTLSKIEIDDNGFKLMNISNSPNGIVYHIAQSYEGKYFQKIPVKQFNELVVFTNNNVLKLYCIFKYTIEGNEGRWTRIDRMYLCRHMGLKETRGNCDNLSVAIKGLKKLGYIKIKQENIVEVDEQGNKKPKTVNYYQLTTYEEWENKE